MIFLDTTVLVAASYDAHPQHQECRMRLAASAKAGAACATHTLSETFAVLTRLPLPLRLTAAEGGIVVERIERALKTIALTPSEHLAVVRDMAARGMGGAIIYDALLLACARKAKATEIYTLNLKHFRAIAPDLASRIFLP